MIADAILARGSSHHQGDPKTIQNGGLHQTGRTDGWSVEEVQVPPGGTDNVRSAAPDPKGQSWLDAQQYPPL